MSGNPICSPLQQSLAVPRKQAGIVKLFISILLLKTCLLVVSAMYGRGSAVQGSKSVQGS